MKKRINIPTILISLVLPALSAVFCAAVLRSGLLPGGWTALLFIALALVDGLLIFLCARPGKRLRFALGLILSLLFAAGLCYGSAVLNRTVNTLQSITEAAPQFSRVCVFVGSEDTARSIEDGSGDCFGILSTADRESTDKAIAQINEGLGLSIKIQEYEGVTALLDALFASEIRSMILNPEYLAIIA